MPEKLTYQDIIDEYRMVSDNYDPWGSAMELWFAIAGELYHRCLCIPYEWNYSTGASCDGKDDDSYWTEPLERVDNADLERLGTFAFRYCQLLKRYDKDY